MFEIHSFTCFSSVQPSTSPTPQGVTTFKVCLLSVDSRRVGVIGLVLMIRSVNESWSLKNDKIQRKNRISEAKIKGLNLQRQFISVGHITCSLIQSTLRHFTSGLGNWRPGGHMRPPSTLNVALRSIFTYQLIGNMKKM
uniref:Uncharacterized protein n=1 Tax=Labrus bergylta TaxID=56723 RepID=A0A3Q3F8N4_9LABR